MLLENKNAIICESYFLEPLLEGELALAADREAEPFVDADDIADVAVAALTDARHVGQLYELTAPRPLRFDEAVAEIARASGRAMRYVPLTIEEFASGMAEEGVPEDVVASEVAKLKREPGGNIAVLGSATLVRTLLEHDVVDEYFLVVFPIVIGSGKRLFGELGEPRNLGSWNPGRPQPVA